MYKTNVITCIASNKNTNVRHLSKVINRLKSESMNKRMHYNSNSLSLYFMMRGYPLSIENDIMTIHKIKTNAIHRKLENFNEYITTTDDKTKLLLHLDRMVMHGFDEDDCLNLGEFIHNMIK